MEDKRVETECAEAGIRKTARGVRPIHQIVRTELTASGYEVSMTGAESGRVIKIRETDPAILEHERRVDHAHYVMSLVEGPPMEEPTRLPIGTMPQGGRLCWVCGGRGQAEDEWEMLLECANCEGEGYVLDRATEIA